MIDAARLREIAAERLVADAQACACAPLQAPGWESVTDERWPPHVERIGTLRPPDTEEPTFEEFHPDGTRYDSADAPIAFDWFPCNRSDVHVCRRCRSAFLRYTEFGGYYIDHRVRLVDPSLVA